MKGLMNPFFVTQRSVGLVKICTTMDLALEEMDIAGCADMTTSTKDELITKFTIAGFHDEIEFFDWEDQTGMMYWHMIDPR